MDYVEELTELSRMRIQQIE